MTHCSFQAGPAQICLNFQEKQKLNEGKVGRGLNLPLTIQFTSCITCIHFHKCLEGDCTQTMRKAISLSCNSKPTWERTRKMEMMRLLCQFFFFFNHCSVSCRELKDASSWSAWIKPPAAAAAACRPNQRMLTYESQGECVYKTCVVCLVWLLSCLCSWPHTDQTNAGCASLKHISRELGEGVGVAEAGSRWSWPRGRVIVSSEETVFTVFQF